MRKELVDLIHEAMEQHELARNFYHRLAHQVAHAEKPGDIRVPGSKSRKRTRTDCTTA